MDNTEPRIADTDGNLERPSLLDPAFRYVPANKVDEAGVLARWRAKINAEKASRTELVRSNAQ